MAEPDTAPAAAPVVAPAAAPVAKRPRGRTALLLVAAAVLGIAGGTAVGYDVQAERAPTPLPALSQPDLAYPAKALPPGRAPDPLPASQDRRVRSDGDLRKLIADRPAGWSDDGNSVLGFGDGWLDVDVYARSFEEEGSMYEYFLQAGIRRVASAAWKRGQHRTTETYLVQFGSTTFQGAKDYAEAQLRYMPGAEIGVGYNGGVIKGSGNGRYCVYEVDRKPGRLPSYHARATVYRGDIVADIHVYDTAPISKKDIRTLAERQLERL
ncbi:hypothetical protein [Streptomyces sp. NBC_00893]|uniref:hypothetical protein n=1 Tax=Streptomyces sp. NBC_00893 TaxID=2975862 RepID=UPI00225BCAA9|nr:hypothetical protein [Streptomyces sp. NBC_00893]MCX4846397.1 hypothetical protein [Streptomyces sp. NBC_00893]